MRGLGRLLCPGMISSDATWQRRCRGAWLAYLDKRILIGEDTRLQHRHRPSRVGDCAAKVTGWLRLSSLLPKHPSPTSPSGSTFEPVSMAVVPSETDMRMIEAIYIS